MNFAHFTVSGADLRRELYARFSVQPAVKGREPVYLLVCRTCDRLLDLHIPRPLDDSEEVSATPMREAIAHHDAHASMAARPTEPEALAAEHAAGAGGE